MTEKSITPNYQRRSHVQITSHSKNTSILKSSEPADGFLIHLKFTGMFRLILCFIREGSSSKLDSIDTPLGDIEIDMKMEDISTYEKARGPIARKLKPWPLPKGAERERMIETVILTTWRTLVSAPVGHNKANLDFHVVSVLENYFHDVVDEESSEGSSSCCAICIDELSKEGDQVVSLPCSHEFHGGCINNWLTRSRHCPVCRFEMPDEIDGINLASIWKLISIRPN